MDPVEILIEEHRNILIGVELLSKTSTYFDKGEVLTDQIDLLLRFFREYADMGHHQKEEDLLFTALYEKNPGLKSEFSPIGVLNQQHVEGRRLVGKLTQKDQHFPEYVSDYSGLLEGHIEMEDELFPLLVEQNFDRKERLNLQTKFLEVEDPNITSELLKLLDSVSLQV